MEQNYEALYEELIQINSNKKHYLMQAKSKFLLCAKHGILKHAVPKLYGGYGDNFKNLCNVYQELGKNTRDSDLLLSLNAHIWGSIFPLIKFGTQSQKNEIKNLLDGTIISGHAITEPSSGSDIKNMQSNAIMHKNGFILNAHKKYITNATIADNIIIYVKFKNNIVPFLVKKSDKNVNFSIECNLDGFSFTPMGEIVLTDCFLPFDRLIGPPSSNYLGSMVIQYSLELERSFIFAGFIGIMEWQIKQIYHLLKNRYHKGNSLLKNQIIEHKIADMRLRKDLSELLINKCAALKDASKHLTLTSSETKLYASEAFLASSLEFVQLLGSLGLETDKMATKFVRDAVAGKILSGTSEIQRNIISSLSWVK